MKVSELETSDGCTGRLRYGILSSRTMQTLQSVTTEKSWRLIVHGHTRQLRNSRAFCCCHANFKKSSLGQWKMSGRGRSFYYGSKE